MRFGSPSVAPHHTHSRRDKSARWLLHIFLALVSLTSLPASAQQRHPECLVPWEWRLPPSSVGLYEGPPGHYRWVRDRNRNRIDDLLEERDGDGFPKDSNDPAKAAGEKIDLVIALNTCLSQKEFEAMMNRWDVSSQSVFEARYLPVVILSGTSADPGLIRRMVNDPNVAMIEWGEPLIPFLTIGKQTIRWTRQSIGNPRGKAVAIIDTGITTPAPRTEDPAAANCVANDTVAESLDATRLSGTWYRGPHCACNKEECGHGSRVWTILAGYPAVSGWGQTGVTAGLPVMDVRACTPNHCRPEDVFRALERILDRRDEIAVVNMSIGGCAEDDGTSSYPQMIDRLAASQVVVVTAMGNADRCAVKKGKVLVGRPASASLAIVVSGVDDRNRTLEPFEYNLSGPRCDGIRPDSPSPLALKPDISAPANLIELGGSYFRGTSLATPFVSGIIATAAAQSSGRPSVCEVKCALRYAAQPVISQQAAGTWHSSLGFGVLDATAFPQQLRSRKACEISLACQERVRTVLTQPPPRPDDVDRNKPCR